MAVMEYTEPNDKKWVGIRPGHKGTQILATATVTSGGTEFVYIVPEGKTFFLCYAVAYPVTAVTADWHLAVIDSLEENPVNILGAHTLSTQYLQEQSGVFNPPIECLEYWRVELVASGTLTVTATIFGWLE